ncbi:MAG: hypothetical protein Q4615_07595 [Paracoccus aminovorans]|nr:hypothetical protein [Paracoccus aminovorans]
MLLTGSSLHLWFLPFAFLVAMLTPMLTRRNVAPIAALSGAAAFCLFGTPENIPLAQWSFGLIPVLVGIAYFTNGWRIAAATLILCWLMLTLGRPSADNITILAGTGVALVVLAVRVAPTRLSSWCAGLSMWVYLAHPLVFVVGRQRGYQGSRWEFSPSSGHCCLRKASRRPCRAGPASDTSKKPILDWLELRRAGSVVRADCARLPVPPRPVDPDPHHHRGRPHHQHPRRPGDHAHRQQHAPQRRDQPSLPGIPRQYHSHSAGRACLAGGILGLRNKPGRPARRCS